MMRSSCRPHVCSSAVVKRSWLNGIRSSTVQPFWSTDVAASQTASHAEIALGTANGPTAATAATGSPAAERRIAPHAVGIDVEPEARAPVVVAVEAHAEPVRRGEHHVAAAEPAGHRRAVRQARRDVDGLAVVDDAHLGGFAAAARPPAGSRCVKSVITVASAHAASSRCPSMRGGVATRRAAEIGAARGRRVAPPPGTAGSPRVDGWASAGSAPRARYPVEGERANSQS